MSNYFINVNYCYQYLVNQIPIGLLMYAHIPAALLAILFGSFLLYKTKNLVGITFFIICLSFATWCFLSISTWFSFLGSANTMFTWSLIDLFGLIMFFFSYYFLYTFVTNNDLPIWQKIIAFFLLLPTAVTTLLGLNLTSYDANTCAAIENDNIVRYPYFVEAVFVISVIIFVINQYKKSKDLIIKNKILLIGSGVSIFLVFFFSATFLVNLLASGDVSTYVYNYEIYGLFGMPILLAFLVYLVVEFKEFNLKLIGAQALVWSLIILIACEFLFVNNLTSQILVGVTLAISGILGFNLVNSVKKEVLLREHLEIANAGQTNLIHIMNHQIKGYLSISKNIFAELLTDDYGKVPEEAKEIISDGLENADKGAKYVAAILRGESAENGTLCYEMKQLDFKSLVSEVVSKEKEIAEKKGLKLNIDIDNSDYNILGDISQLGEAVRNLIDNSIFYTPSGSVEVSLINKSNSVLLKVKDTGVGVKEEDKPKLFKAGGVGSDSIKININSSGYGLAFVKGVIEKHRGKVWFESAGAGLGSTFFIELPVR